MCVSLCVCLCVLVRTTTTTCVTLRSGVTINTYKVIYNLIDDVKAAMEGKLRSVEERLPLGEATVRRRQPPCLPPAHFVA